MILSGIYGIESWERLQEIAKNNKKFNKFAKQLVYLAKSQDYIINYDERKNKDLVFYKTDGLIKFLKPNLAEVAKYKST